MLSSQTAFSLWGRFLICRNFGRLLEAVILSQITNRESSFITHLNVCYWPQGGVIKGTAVSLSHFKKCESDVIRVRV